MAITYRGKTFSGYNKPRRATDGKKKFEVLAKEGDQVRLVRFGDVKGGLTIKKDQPSRKKSYYARHNAQGKPTSKLSAKYWSHKTKW